MNITTYRVKQYNSTYKTVVCVDDKPVCIVSGIGKTLSNIIAYLNGYNVDIADGKIKIALDNRRAESESIADDKSICDSCVNTGCILTANIIRKHCDFYK